MELPDHIKALGADQVRLMISTGQLAPAFHSDALGWLAAEDLAASRSKEANNARVMKTARNANRIAIAAMIIAAICMIMQVIAMWAI